MRAATDVSPRLPAASAVAVVVLGGAVGAAARAALGALVPDGTGFPATTFAINVAGSLLLGALPALEVVHRHRLANPFLGSGLLGGFTTLSLYAEQGRALAADGRSVTALAYVLGTLGACVAAVLLADRLSTPAQRRHTEDGEGDR